MFGIVEHQYVNASDNLAQYHADKECVKPRQEVTIDFYLDYLCDESFWRWIGDQDAEMGLDPWRYHMDLPIEAEEAKALGWRIFVQQDKVDEILLQIADENYRAKIM